MLCILVVFYWVWESFIREVVRKIISIRVYFYINNLFIYYVERKLLNRLYVYRYKMVEIYMLLC